MTWTHPAYEAVIRQLGARTGLCFPAHRQDSVELGIRRVMTRAGATDPAQFSGLIEADGQVLDDLIVELTVGETYFFRELAQFEFIRREVLPELRRRRGGELVVRAWSAGCASGEEAYSLAILFEEERLADQAHLLATDISRAALTKAHRADYSPWSLRGEGVPAAQRYLHRRGERLVLDEKIRRRVTFQHLNLALDSYPSFATGTWGMDLILCRNVLIYFDRETIRKVAGRLFASLAAGGWLLTASSDPPLAGDAPYETVVTSAGVCYRRGAEGASSATEVPGTATLARLFAPPPVATVPAALPNLVPSPVSFPPPLVEKVGEVGGAADPLAEARNAFARGDYARTRELTRGLTEDAATSALHVRALANLDTSQAERACAEALARHPLSTELHYLHTVLLLDLGRDEQAAQAARRVIYLDRSLAVAHFTLGSILWRRGDRAGARRAYRNTRDLCAARPADEVIPLSDGEQAGRLAEAAAAQLAILATTREATG